MFCQLQKHLHSLLFTGRIDRKIEFPLPDEKTKRKIFQIHTSKMTLADDVDLEEYIMAKCNSTVINDIHLLYCHCYGPTSVMMNDYYKCSVNIHIDVMFWSNTSSH